MTIRQVPVGDVSLEVEVAGTGQPLLLVHGFPLDHQMWVHQISALSLRYQVIAPDLRGFGGSPSDADKVRMEEFADDLAALLDGLEIKEPVVLCGLSMGGYIAFQFVKRHRQRLKGLVLCDTRAAADTPEAAANRLTTADKVIAEGVSFLAAGMSSKLFSATTLQEQPAIVQATTQVMVSTSPQAVAAALRGMAERPDVTSDLQAIDLPTLVIAGADDAIVPPREMQAMAAAIPQGKYVEVPQAGHMAPLESPQLVNEALIEFLAQCK